MKYVCCQVDSQRAQVGGVRAWHGRKNSPICFIPKQDHIEDYLEKTKKSIYFKLTLPNTQNELKEVIWAFGPEQFRLHVRTAIHVCKQIGLDTNYTNVTTVLEATYCELDATKTEYSQLAKATKKNTKDQKEKDANPDPVINAMSSPLAAAKTACKEATPEVKEAKLTIMTAGAKQFELYCNLLSNKAKQPWEKVM